MPEIVRQQQTFFFNAKPVRVIVREDGTPVLQLKWLSSILNEVRRELANGAVN